MWRTLESSLLLDHAVLRVEKARRQRADGLRHDFVRLHSPDWVNVIPVTPEGRVVLIRQWRQGTDQVALEIPGGIIDPGETPAQAAVRELLEETGFRAANLAHLGWVHPNPALFSNVCHTFLASGAYADQPQRPEDVEEIEVTSVAAEELPGLVAGGAITHSLVVAALTKWWLAGGWPGRADDSPKGGDS